MLSAVISEVTTEISSSYERDTMRGAARDSIGERATGGVTFIQRFNSALTLSPHLHIVFMDGVYAESAEGRKFYGVKYFDSSNVITILSGIVNRLDRLFRDWGYVTKEGEPAEPSWQTKCRCRLGQGPQRLTARQAAAGRRHTLCMRILTQVRCR